MPLKASHTKKITSFFRKLRWWTKFVRNLESGLFSTFQIPTAWGSLCCLRLDRIWVNWTSLFKNIHFDFLVDFSRGWVILMFQNSSYWKNPAGIKKPPPIVFCAFKERSEKFFHSISWAFRRPGKLRGSFYRRA